MEIGLLWHFWAVEIRKLTSKFSVAECEVRWQWYKVLRMLNAFLWTQNSGWASLTIIKEQMKIFQISKLSKLLLFLCNASKTTGDSSPSTWAGPQQWRRKSWGLEKWFSQWGTCHTRMRTWGWVPSTHVKSQVEWCMPIVPRLGGRGRRILRTLLARFRAITGIYDTGWQYICDFVLFKSLVCNHDETLSPFHLSICMSFLSPLFRFFSLSFIFSSFTMH